MLLFNVQNLEGYVSITYQFTFLGPTVATQNRRRRAGRVGQEFRPLMLEKTNNLQSPSLTYKVLNTLEICYK